jgi:hypothetical protein
LQLIGQQLFFIFTAFLFGDPKPVTFDSDREDSSLQKIPLEDFAVGLANEGKAEGLHASQKFHDVLRQNRMI